MAKIILPSIYCFEHILSNIYCALVTDNLVRITCEPFTKFIDRDRVEIDDAVESLLAEIETINSGMEEFKDSVKVNTKFYL